MRYRGSTASGRRSVLSHGLRRGLVLLAVTTAVVALGAVGHLPGAAPSGRAWAAQAANGCPPSGCVDVDPDPKDAAFLGTGGLLIPGSSFTGSETDQRAVATCADCAWALVPLCKRGVDPGIGCGPGATSCPPGSRRMVVLLQRPPDPRWGNVGSYCVSGGPLTVDDVARQLSDVVVERVPALRPTYQPVGGTVVNLPAIFSSGQPDRLDTRTFSLVGFEVVLDARASWRWDFGDGQQLATDSPGGRWPDRTVSHTYARPGTALVRVTSEWRGWFTVDGMGPFTVGGVPVTQVSPAIPLVVHEARAVLVGE